MPFAWVLELLAPLFKKWQTWAFLILAALAFYILSLRGQLAAANAALAARPTVHTESEQQLKIVRVAGPVHYETKTVYVPGTDIVQYVDRVVTRDPVTTTTEKETEIKRDVTPACAPQRHYGRYIGLADGLPQEDHPRLRAGLTFGDRLDLGVAYDTRFSPLNGAAQVEASWRF